MENYVQELSNDDLIEHAKIAYDDLKTASEISPNSSMHSEAYAGLFLLSEEMTKRNLKISTVH